MRVIYKPLGIVIDDNVCKCCNNKVNITIKKGSSNICEKHNIIFIMDDCNYLATCRCSWNNEKIVICKNCEYPECSICKNKIWNPKCFMNCGNIICKKCLTQKCSVCSKEIIYSNISNISEILICDTCTSDNLHKIN